MKNWLKKQLKAKEEARSALREKVKSSNEVAEVRSLGEQIESLNAEITELRSMIDSLPDDEEVGAGEERNQQSQEQRNTPQGGINILGAYGFNQGQSNQNEERSTDKYDTPEYRSAFMDYVTKGTKSDSLEFRADATTGTGDLGAVIPTTVLNKIVERLKDHGRIWARVTKTSIKGGVQIPKSNAKPTATWVAAGSMSDKQKKEVKGYISFKYHKLQCRVAVELVADTVAMPVFEETVSENIYEAMIVALEAAIISGSGNGQPLGIINDTDIPEKQIVEVSAEDLGKYNTWTELFGKVPRKYRSGAELILNDSDWTKYVEGMVDANGQPVARVTYGLDGTIQEKLLGKDAIPVEDYLPSIDDAEEGDVIAIICKLPDYMVNSNMQLFFKRYFNEENDEWVSKSTLIADGKLADHNGVVLIKKKAEAAV